MYRVKLLKDLPVERDKFVESGEKTSQSANRLLMSFNVWTGEVFPENSRSDKVNCTELCLVAGSPCRRMQ